MAPSHTESAGVHWDEQSHVSSLGSLDELSSAGLDQRLGARPSQDDDIAILSVHTSVDVGAAALHLGVAQEADKDGSIEIRGVDHADVAGSVVQILKRGGE